MYSAMSFSSAKRSASEWTGASAAPTLAMATSDHQVSLRRSSNGKSKSVASIIVVSSTETRSTQSNVSPRGSPSSTRAVRSRMVPSRWFRFSVATIGATTRRCWVCLGGSMRMKLGRLMSFG